MVRLSSLPGASSSGDSQGFELFRTSQGGHHSSHLYLFLFYPFPRKSQNSYNTNSFWVETSPRVC
jgi:hypothetical protein